MDVVSARHVFSAEFPARKQKRSDCLINCQSRVLPGSTLYAIALSLSASHPSGVKQRSDWPGMHQAYALILIHKQTSLCTLYFAQRYMTMSYCQPPCPVPVTARCHVYCPQGGHCTLHIVTCVLPKTAQWCVTVCTAHKVGTVHCTASHDSQYCP